ncbi:HD family phosphohydrolase [Nocardia sp. CA-128927]|uniref:HD family phosphohydrolase n=1 Tax=Nocardia sp. CA-128927 TaxID=3239975 RepID=UPI003D984C7F
MSELMTSGLIDEILAEHREDWSCGDDEGWAGYRNHAQRVFLFARELTAPGVEVDERIAIAAAFHDIAALRTVDYLDLDLEPMRAWLAAYGRPEWYREIALAMTLHHRIRPYRGEAAWLVEGIRRADWIECSAGLLRSGLSRDLVRRTQRALPMRKFAIDSGIKIVRHALTHPGNPLPFWRSGPTLRRIAQVEP